MPFDILIVQATVFYLRCCHSFLAGVSGYTSGSSKSYFHTTVCKACSNGIQIIFYSSTNFFNKCSLLQKNPNPLPQSARLCVLKVTSQFNVNQPDASQPRPPHCCLCSAWVTLLWSPRASLSAHVLLSVGPSNTPPHSTLHSFIVRFQQHLPGPPTKIGLSLTYPLNIWWQKLVVILSLKYISRLF